MLLSCHVHPSYLYGCHFCSCLHSQPKISAKSLSFSSRDPVEEENGIYYGAFTQCKCWKKMCWENKYRQTSGVLITMLTTWKEMLGKSGKSPTSRILHYVDDLNIRILTSVSFNVHHCHKNKLKRLAASQMNIPRGQDKTLLILRVIPERLSCLMAEANYAQGVHVSQRLKA